MDIIIAAGATLIFLLLILFFVLLQSFINDLHDDSGPVMIKEEGKRPYIKHNHK